MPKLWAAGLNRPGYLPDGDGAEPFESFGDAVQFLIGELELEAERQAEDCESDAAAEQCDKLAAELLSDAPPNRDWSGTAAGFEWWIKGVEQ